MVWVAADGPGFNDLGSPPSRRSRHKGCVMWEGIQRHTLKVRHAVSPVRTRTKSLSNVRTEQRARKAARLRASVPDLIFIPE